MIAVAVREERDVDIKVLPRAAPFPDNCVRPAWRFEDSVFAPYRRPTTGFIAKCFDNDWDITKIPNFIKDGRELDRTADVIRPHYRVIMEMFK